MRGSSVVRRDTVRPSCLPSRSLALTPFVVGHDEGGQLTEAVRRRPYCVILIDELEKACKEFTTILLQVLDDGRLTDGKGTVVNFRNTGEFLSLLAEQS